MNFKTLLEKFDKINNNVLTEAKAEMKPYKPADKKDKEVAKDKAKDKKTNESMWDLMQVYHALEQKTIVLEEKARYSVKLEHPDGKIKNVNVEASSESDAKKKATNDPKWRAVSARKLGAAAEIKESSKEEVEEEKTDEGNAVTGGLADPDVKVGEKIPGTDVTKKKHITTEAEDKDDDDKKDDDDDDKKDDDDKEEVNESTDSEHHVYTRHKDDKGKIKYKLIKSFSGHERGEEAQDHADKWNDKQKDSHTRAIVKTKKIKEAVDFRDLEECYDSAMSGPQQQESGMSINASTDTRTGNKSLSVTAQGESAEQLARLLKLSGIGGGQTSPEGEMQVSVESDYANEPAVEVQGLEPQLQQGNDMHRPKNSYPKVSGGDNPMNMREAEELRALERRLNEELAAFKVVAEGSRVKEPSGNYRDPHTGRLYSSPDGKDGNDGYRTPEYMLDFYKKKLAQIAAGPYKRTKEVAQLRAKIAKLEKQGVAEGKGKKPDFLDMDKDGDKKEPMKKAIADKSKKK